MRKRKPKPHAPLRAVISTGDVIFAMRRLKPTDDANIELILKILGMEALPPSETGVGAWQPNVRSDQPAVQPRSPTADAAPPIAVTRQAPHLAAARVSANRIGTVTFGAPDWASAAARFKPAAGDSSSEPPPPLFARRTSRALLSTALATTREGSELDVDRVSAIVATKFRLDRIPYRAVSTLRRGVQVLIDESEGMNPFRDDVQQVLEELNRLFGRAQLEVRRFAHCPGRGVRASGTGKREPWRPPAPGAPVVLISDFGLTPVYDDKVASLAEWLSFAATVRASGCPMVALAPFGPQRWPPALARWIAFVHWSERTTVRQIARSLRESRVRTEARS